MINETDRHVVVLGAGFGGLTFCQKFKASGAQVTLVDRQNHHLFQPLLYQVATAGLSATEIAQPIRSILSDKPHVTVLMENVFEVKLAERKVILEKNCLSYDYLVLALGGVTSYFGHPDWEPFAPGLKSLDDALRIRRNILLSFEQAENQALDEERESRLTIVVVGGGPTGVEMAGAIAELARRVLRRDFRRIDPGNARILLVEGGSRLLSHLPPELSAKAQKELERLGVQVRLGKQVEEMGARFIQLDGQRIQADNIIWAAGVSANPITRQLGVELDRAGRIKVNPDLSVPGHREVFAIGDLALVMDEHGHPVPGVSPAAMQMARHVARLIEDDIKAPGPGMAYRPAFRYWDKGVMATIGRSAAVVQIGKLGFDGFAAWLAWLGIHLIFMIGFRNKIAVLLQWAYAYLTFKRGARIITGLSENDPNAPPTPGRS